MASSLHLFKENRRESDEDEGDCTNDGTVDRNGKVARRDKTGTWVAGIILLCNEGLATLAFFGVGVNLVLFQTRVLQQSNAEAANNVSKWTGTVYLFSLLGAFLSDSYWGRYKSCFLFQIVFLFGLVSLSLSTQKFLIKPMGCGSQDFPCGSHSTIEMALFYISIYLIGLGYGGYQPNVTTFGADQFDEQHLMEIHSKVAFFSYFYLSLNLGSLFSNTVLGYFEDEGIWALGYWTSAGSAAIGLALFLLGTPRYRHFKPTGNPLSRLCRVIIAAARKWRVQMPDTESLYDSGSVNCPMRKIIHTDEFKFLDRAAYISSKDLAEMKQGGMKTIHWSLCSVTQVEEVKCILRLLPIWLCTIIYSLVFTQMASLFVEQGAAMKTTLSTFHIPPAGMSAFDILSVAAFIFISQRLINPFVSRLKKGSNGLTELQRMGIGLLIAVVAMLAAGTTERYRVKYASHGLKEGSSSLSILWQVPQYALIGASEVFMYVGQLEFFNTQAPDGLKSFGSALCMMSMSLGNYVSSLVVTLIMRVSKRPGWIPGDLNKGRLDMFYFLLAVLTMIDLAVYVACAVWYKGIQLEDRCRQEEKEDGMI